MGSNLISVIILSFIIGPGHLRLQNTPLISPLTMIDHHFIHNIHILLLIEVNNLILWSIPIPNIGGHISNN